MPSALPTPENDYLATPPPGKLVLDREMWNLVFNSIGSRLRLLEDVNSGIEAIKLELQTFGIQRLDEAINPLIEETQESLSQLQAALAQAQQELSDTVDDANAAFAAALATANASLADLQEQLDQMLGGGVPAVNVAVAEIDGLAATTAQAAFAELLDNIATAVTTLTTAIESKADASALDDVIALTAGVGTIVTADLTAVAGGEYFVKTAGGAVTVTLPVAPVDGNIITVWRYGVNAVSIVRNGKTINYVADDIQIDADRVFLQFKYFDGNWTALPGKF